MGCFQFGCFERLGLIPLMVANHFENNYVLLRVWPLWSDCTRDRPCLEALKSSRFLNVYVNMFMICLYDSVLWSTGEMPLCLYFLSEVYNQRSPNIFSRSAPFRHS